jgi:hypothetical protein
VSSIRSLDLLQPHDELYSVYNETTKQWEDTDEGLTADSIECPVVDINSVSYQDGKNRAVKLSVTIDTGTMTYIDDDGKDQSVNVDGWTFSWLAALGDVYIADLDTGMRVLSFAGWCV